MKALITGASSGIGRDMARYLSKKGIDLIAVARDKEALIDLKNELNNIDVKVIDLDLSIEENCLNLYEQTKNDGVDILINNAGFGVYGEFRETPLEKELKLIDTNIKAVHILTKLFLNDMIDKENKYILNTASIAGFFSGPLMSSYYGSKAYVIHLSRAIKEELRRKKSKVSISILCPGSVATKFNESANRTSSLKTLTSDYVAKYAIDKMFEKKFVIIPGMKSKFLKAITKILPDGLVTKILYNIQNNKGVTDEKHSNNR